MARALEISHLVTSQYYRKKAGLGAKNAKSGAVTLITQSQKDSSQGRVFNVDVEICTKCGGNMKIIAAIAAAIRNEFRQFRKIKRQKNQS
jgi:hypothetical protein